MSDLVTPVTTTKGTFRVRLEQDQDAESPRSYDNLGTMVLAHRRYSLPREGDLTSEIDDAFERGGYRLASRYLTATKQALVVLPVYGYDHGQLVLQAGDPQGQFSDPWDSGLAGLIYITPEAVKENWTETPDADHLTAALKAEVEEYNSWATGDVYGYIVEKLVPECDHCGCEERWEETDDSCWGLIGYEYAQEAAREALQAES